MNEIEAPASGESRRQQRLPRSTGRRASPRLYPDSENRCFLPLVLATSPRGPRRQQRCAISACGEFGREADEGSVLVPIMGAEEL